jgi:hypothetical protein
MTDRLPDDDDDPPEPRRLRALRRLVTLLTATLIVGIVAVAAALVIRIAGPAPERPGFDAASVTAERLVLPADEAITAVGAAGGALLVATRDAAGAERLRLYDAATGAALREIAVARAP